MGRVGKDEAVRCQAQCEHEAQAMDDAMDKLNSTGTDDTVDILAMSDYLTFQCV